MSSLWWWPTAHAAEGFLSETSSQTDLTTVFKYSYNFAANKLNTSHNPRFTSLDEDDVYMSSRCDETCVLPCYLNSDLTFH